MSRRRRKRSRRLFSRRRKRNGWGEELWSRLKLVVLVALLLFGATVLIRVFPNSTKRLAGYSGEFLNTLVKDRPNQKEFSENDRRDLDEIFDY